MNRLSVVKYGFVATVLSAMFLDPFWPAYRVLSMIYKGWPCAWLTYPIPPADPMFYDFNPLAFGLCLAFWVLIVFTVARLSRHAILRGQGW